MNNNCPNWTKHDLELFNSCSFYVSGVAVTCVAVPGLILNLLAICILSTRLTTKNNFNQLVISLFVFDSIYLFSWFIENFRRNFNLSTTTHVIMLPKILYPMFGIETMRYKLRCIRVRNTLPTCTCFLCIFKCINKEECSINYSMLFSRNLHIK